MIELDIIFVMGDAGLFRGGSSCSSLRESAKLGGIVIGRMGMTCSSRSTEDNLRFGSCPPPPTEEIFVFMRWWISKRGNVLET